MINKFKFSKTDFTRNKKLTFSVTILIISNLIRKSLSLELVNFIDSFKRYTTTELSSFSQSAFIQSRNKIKPEVFKYLSNTITSEFYSDNDLSIKLWNGFRPLAVDSSRLNLPDRKELENIYGRTNNQNGTGVIQTRISILYDVLNNMVIDSKLVPLKTGEIVLAKEHLEYSKKGDLIIYDRGYPSFELVFNHNKREVDFLFRVKVSFNTLVKNFVSSGKRSQIVELMPDKNRCYNDKEFSKNSIIKVRLVSVILDDGSIEVLMTSLLDSKKYRTKIFKDLYFKRWGVETYYDEIKNKLKVKCFLGYSNNTIHQNFYVVIFISNIKALIVSDLEEENQEETKGR